MVHYEPISRASLPGVMALLQAEGWPSYTANAEVAWKALTAPGAQTVVALVGGHVVGVAQMLSDGQVVAFLSILIVHRDYRRRGIGRELVCKAFERTGARRGVDLLTDSADTFYRSFAHHEFRGFRVYPEAAPDET
jgi:ribosomal protein S18 acetylase RimI-like enzyme